MTRNFAAATTFSILVNVYVKQRIQMIKELFIRRLRVVEKKLRSSRILISTVCSYNYFVQLYQLPYNYPSTTYQLPINYLLRLVIYNRNCIEIVVSNLHGWILLSKVSNKVSEISRSSPSSDSRWPTLITRICRAM